jgi:hypothetical protein
VHAYTYEIPVNHHSDELRRNASGSVDLVRIVFKKYILIDHVLN